MGQLDPYFLTLAMHKLGDALDGRDLAVLPETGVFRGDAAVGQNGGGFDYGEGGAAVGKRGEVCKVEVRKVPVRRGIHAHWCNPDAILEG